ncbi:Type I Iterative PKS [Paecilomyces lecythidis]
MLLRDPDTVPMHQCTNAGQSRAITANRISYFFDLKGPSVTVDTACSGSLVAVHLACQSLRTGDAKLAVAAGVNTILSHEFMTTMSMMKFLSPDGRCYTFDERASGYGRGEGVGCLILKPLADALRDNDTIRAVIRGSGSNQDGKTTGITLPNGAAQEELVRGVYEAAGIDPLETEYVEAHGTGTQAGDPLETGALSRVFCPGRSPEKPLRVGSIKTNVGHLEGASGVAGMVKAILMLENRIFLPSRNFKKLNPRIPLEQWKLKVQLETEPWETPGPHRVSVNSFGYGGSNAHVILENTEGYLSDHGLDGSHRKAKVTVLAPENGLHHDEGVNGVEQTKGKLGVSGQPRLFVLSSFDEVSGKRQAELLQQYLLEKGDSADDEFMNNLAFTLGTRRTNFIWKAAMPGTSATNLAENLSQGVNFSRATKKPTIGFVFTGQGAQWCGMGKELLNAYPTFGRSIDKIGAYLKSLGAPFDVREEITRDPEGSQINLAILSQPMCSALQIALVDLLTSWGIKPASVTGHSSGEIAAAYTMGALSWQDAMTVAYYRGVVSSEMSERSQSKGAMMAVGLSQEDAESYVTALKNGKAVVACVNSPSSVTISGDASAIDELKGVLDEKKLFARKLAVEVAYHSHHMQLVGDEYRESLSGIRPNERTAPDSPEFFSSVTGEKAASSELGPEYWVNNMLGQVKFAQSVRLLCLETTDPSTRSRKTRRRAGAASKASVDMIIEIGPHAALGGPIKQTLKADRVLNAASIAYASALIRKADAVTTVLNLAGTLVSSKWPLDLVTLNTCSKDAIKDGMQVLVDLPPYPWNHSNTYWAEPRTSKVYRNRKFPRTDLLGVLDPHSSPLEPRWRNHIRISEIPWVQDHQIQSNVVYPAAGYIVMAIEAISQWASGHVPDKKIIGYTLREVNIGAALVIGDDTPEVLISLHPYRNSARGASKSWHGFSILSVTDDNKWTEHSTGLIRVHFDTESGDSLTREGVTSRQTQQSITDAKERCTISVNTQEFYEHLNQLGLGYGETFANMKTASCAHDTCVAELVIPNTAATMPKNFEHPFVIHPATLDSTLHALFVAASAERGPLEDPAVPISVDEIFVSPALTRKPGDKLNVYAFTDTKDENNLVASVFATDQTHGRVGLSIKGMTCRVLPRDADDKAADRRLRIAYNVQWEADPDLLSPVEVEKLCGSAALSTEELQQLELYEDCAHAYITEALSRLGKSIPGDIKPHLQKLWAFLVDAHSKRTTVAGDLNRAVLIEKAQNGGPEGKLLCAIGEQLPAILTGELDPWKIMTANSRLEEYWNETTRFVKNYEVAARYLQLLGNKNPHQSILEINGGTGGISLPLLRALGGKDGANVRLKRYTYTDSDSALFDIAKEKLSEWANLLKFKELNVEEDVEDQGFEPHSYDVVVLGHGLFLNKSKHQVLKNVRTLLKDGGRFLFIDTISEKASVARSMVLGTLPSWWTKEEQSKHCSNSFTESEWHQALQETQFSGLDVSLRDTPATTGYESSVMIAQATHREKKVQQSLLDILVISEQQDCGVAVNRLVDGLRSIDAKVQVSPIANAQPEDRMCIVLSDLSTPLLAKPDAIVFETIKSIFTRAKGVLWVTRGGVSSGINPTASLVSGFARTARAESDGSNIVTLDLDAEQILPNDSAADVILRLFQRRLAAGFHETVELDVEYAEKEGVIHIPRIVEDAEVNENLTAVIGQAAPIDQPLHQPGRKLRAVARTPGQFDSICFVDDDTQQPNLPDDYIAIEVTASGLGQRDLQLVKGPTSQCLLGAQCSGVVYAVGKSVTDFCIGDRVATLGSGMVTNYHQDKASSFQKIPEDVSFEQAAAVPVAYCTAYYVVYHLARIRSTDKNTVLIHNVAQPTGQAIVEFLRLLGVRILGTVGSPAERDFVVKNCGIPEDRVFLYSYDSYDSFTDEIMWITNSNGVDVVVDLEGGDEETLRLYWNCIAPYGQFIELDEKRVANNSRLEMANFSKDTLFASFSLSNLWSLRRGVAEKVWADVMTLLRTKAIRGPTSLSVHAYSDIGGALAELESGSMTNVVVTAPPGAVVKALPEDKSGELFRPDASYLLVGGLGGIGRAAASWMIDHGARNLIFANRSGLARAESREAVDQLQAKGATVAVYSCDIINETQVAEMASKAAQDMPPIRGVIQAAMVLRDTLIEKLSVEDYNMVVQPKFQGTWNLHKYLPREMDFFTMLSSVSGIIGNATQSAYAAGNTFMDAFSTFRNRQGLPATTLDLGVITGVGYLSENKELLAAMEKQGFEGTDEQMLMALILTAITKPQRQGQQAQILTGLGRWEEGKSLGNFAEALFAHFRRQSHTSDQAGGDSDADRTQEELRASQTLDEATNVVCTALTNKIATRLGTVPENINTSKGLSEYGVDSLVAVEMRTWIAKEMASTIPILELLASSSLLQLSAKIASRSTFVKLQEPSA